MAAHKYGFRERAFFAMRAVKIRSYFTVIAIFCGVMLASQCSQNPLAETEKTTAYLNWGDSAKYVGMSVCAQCHVDIYKSFVHTGMGQSFGAATREKSSGNFTENNFLYDSILDFTYTVFWRNDSLFISELRLQDGKKVKYGTLEYNEVDVAHLRTQHINYIVGSGQHTNSHIFSEGGYLFQAPFTYYTQSGKLDFPPGFEGGNNARFSRIIGLECMSCHNAMPTGFVAGSENKFEKVPNGIDCERCHGPGSLHVAKIGRGEITDTAHEIDYSIVNPKKLSSALQFEICQRCHLQGNTVLVEGKSFFDFKPGMHLDSVMTTFLPRYQNSDQQFIMASHVDRLKQSKCFVAGKGNFSCTSCHNPHVTVRETNTATFNKTCNGCHSAQKKNLCTASEEKQLAANKNCVRCHMPSSGSTDIPHVTVHDHYIRKPQKISANSEQKGAFLGLASINTKKPNQRSIIRAYLQQFERFEQDNVFLDSAQSRLQKQNAVAFWQEWIHFYYLKNEPSGIVGFVEKNGGPNFFLSNIKTASFSNEHAWAAYRIAEAYRKFDDFNLALRFASKAVELAPNHPEFRLKQSSIFALQNNYAAAEVGYKKVLAQNSLLGEAWSNLGYVQLAQNNMEEAEKSLIKALTLDPDYTMAKVNLASVYLATKRYARARSLLENVLAKEPENKRVRAALDYLNAENL